MLFSIKVFSGSSREYVDGSQTRLKVYVREAARQGAANKGVVRVLTHHFDLPEGSLRIVRGHKSMNKIVKISQKTDQK